MHVLRTDDVIVAVSSPAGRAARGIVRLTGPGAVACAGTLFAPMDGRPLDAHSSWRVIPGRLQLQDGVAVPCNAVVFRPPRSYTGQPLVELHVAGSPALLEMALRACMGAGARLAGPGEFTARAFLTGRMDLVSAEGVQEKIAARSDAQLMAAQQLAAGTLAERVRAATSELTDLLSLVEAGIDFADEPIEFIDGEALGRRLAALAAGLEDLLARSLDMQRLEVLPRVALAGPVNAGKSRLLNQLTGLDRSICSPIPGTTRDVLSAVMDTPAGQVLLLDGPGLGPVQGEIDRIAQEAWRDLLGRVDLVLLVLPADGVYDDSAVMEAVAGRRCLRVVNKADLLNAAGQEVVRRRVAASFGGSVWMVSAATGAGCEELREAIGAMVAGAETSGQGRIVLTARHSEALREGLAAVRAAGDLVGWHGPLGELGAGPAQRSDAGLRGPDERAAAPAELVALHLREAAGHLGLITGQVTTEELLERVFSRFCIGK
jgi:tRNA modification GTPase